MNDITAAALKQLRQYKHTAESAVSQLTDEQLYWKPNEASNSIAAIITHMAGNMLSRFTNFLTEDGEKAWRNRDAEFNTQPVSRHALLTDWEKGWDTVFNALEGLTDQQLADTVYIRGEALTVTQAIIRQVAHYPYHVGQIVYIGKLLLGDKWQSLSIPKGQSDEYTAEVRQKAKQPVTIMHGK